MWPHGSGGAARAPRAFSLATLSCLVLALAVVGATPAAAVVPVAPNPPIAKACGIDVSLVLDASGSVQSSGAVSSVRTAAADFLDALNGTGSTARVLQFATLAEELAARQVVDDGSLGQNGGLRDAITGYYNPIPPRPSDVDIYRYRSGSPTSTGSWSLSNSSNQYTNWQQALDLTATETAELVVFITDGDPTAYDFNQPGDPFDQGPPSDVGVGTNAGGAESITIDRGITSANAVKNAGSRILAVGVGAALQNEASVNRLTQVSGPDVARTVDEFDVETTDVALVRDFDDLAAAVRRLVLELCSPSLTIRKLAQSAGSANYEPAPGWDITTTPTVPGGSFAWILPTGATGASSTVTTSADGFAPFQWEPTPSTALSNAQVQETLLPGFTPGREDQNGTDPPDYRCEFKDIDGNVRVVSGELVQNAPDDPTATFALTGIGAEIGTCSVWNSFDYQPDIALTKVNAPTVVRGDLDPAAQVTSTYEVTNPGNTPLSDIRITDDKCGPVRGVPQTGTNVGDTNGDGRLDNGETWQFSCTRDIAAAQSPGNTGNTITNTATVQGTDPAGTVVNATASADISVYIPRVALTKLVNGVSSANVANGTSVTYSYAASNTGNLPLGSVTLDDDTAPCEAPDRGPDNPGNNDAILDVGETWTYLCTATPTQSVVNTATVTGTPLNPTNTSQPFPGTNPTVTDSDSASVTVYLPGLRLTKEVDQDVVFPGTTATYTYRAENIGDADLRNDTGNVGWVTDDECSPVVQTVDGAGDNVGDVNADGLLNPGETWTFSCSTAITAQTVNTATISAQPVDADGNAEGAPLEREAIAEVQIVSGGIQLTKTALVPVVLDPDAGPIAGPDVPDVRPAQYLYEVANTGDVPIREVVVSDDTCAPLTLDSGDTNTNTFLDVGEVWTYTCTTTLDRDDANTPPVTGDESGLVTNTATVTGTPFLAGDPVQTTGQVTDSDTAQVLVIEPSLVLTKTATADEAAVDSAGVLTVRADQDVTYTVTVANTGDVGLELIGPADDKCEPLTYVSGDTNSNGLLDGADSGGQETWTYTCTRAVPLPPDGEAIDTNVSLVAAFDPLGNVYLAADTAEVRPIDPAIRLVKSVSQSLVPVGTEVTYGFEVTNVGQSPVPADDVLADVSLIDVSAPEVPSCLQPTLVSKTGGNDDDFLDREPAEVWTYSCTATINDPTTNLALVAAVGGTTFGLELPVLDLDAAFVQPFRPAIEVVKTAEPTSLFGGGDVAYTYQVRNTGDVPLSGVADRITDDTCSPVVYVSGDEDGDGLLDTPNSIFEDSLDETWIFTCTTAVNTTTTNVVTVTGTPTDPAGQALCGPTDLPRSQIGEPCDVTGQDTATVTVAQPGSVTIIKKTTTPSAAAFSFTVGSQTFTLTDGQSTTITDVPPGTYTVVESPTANWRLDGIVCADPTSDSAVDVGAAQATVTVADGEAITCTFTNAVVTQPVVPPDGGGSGNLPNTGLTLGWQLLVSGLGLVVLGSLVLAVTRRRHA